MPGCLGNGRGRSEHRDISILEARGDDPVGNGLGTQVDPCRNLVMMEIGYLGLASHLVPPSQ